jgi:hypothetical protein
MFMEHKLDLKRILTYVGAYSAWLVASAAGLVDFLLFRAAINQVYVLAGWKDDAFHFVDRLALFIVGGAFIFVMFLGEGYFNDAVKRNDLRRRVVKTFSIEAVVGGVLYVIPLLAAALKS